MSLPTQSRRKKIFRGDLNGCIEPVNHPEMSNFDKQLKETIRLGMRKQDKLNPQKYRYIMPFDDLIEHNTHIVAIVLFRFEADNLGNPVPNNYIVTAYQKEIG